MTRRWCIRALQATAVCVAFGGLAAMHGEAASPSPPHVMAVVSSARGLTLRPLDARTLEPLRGGWSRAIAKGAATALSPSGARVAITVGDDRLLILNTATGRVEQRYRDAGDSSWALYWLGGNGTGTKGDRPERLLALGYSCNSGICGNQFSVVGRGGSTVFDGEAAYLTALPEGLAFAFEPTFLYIYGLDVYGLNEWYFLLKLPRMPTAAPLEFAADVADHRLFAVSSAGLVAEIDRIGELGRKPRVSYHRVDLNGHGFAAAWAGAGRIALWGQDGLGTIDTRTWKTQAIAPGVTGALATPFGLAAWTANPADGLTVYRPDGKRRLRVLAGKRIHTARAVGGYLYADTDANDRYSVDLRTGKVVGPLSTDATILVPDLVAIP